MFPPLQSRIKPVTFWLQVQSSTTELCIQWFTHTTHSHTHTQTGVATKTNTASIIIMQTWLGQPVTACTAVEWQVSFHPEKSMVQQSEAHYTMYTPGTAFRHPSFKLCCNCLHHLWGCSVTSIIITVSLSVYQNCLYHVTFASVMLSAPSTKYVKSLSKSDCGSSVCPR